MFRTSRVPSKLVLRAVRCNSTAASTTPPLMAKLRSDLKDAMRAKDTTRLNVLRAIIADTTNASKTSSPIQTDVQLLSLIKKRIAAAKDAGQQFLEANRPDLKEQEDAQIAVMEEYAGQVQTMGHEEIQAAVQNVIGQLQSEGQKPNVGSVLKALLSPGGALDGKPVEKAEVAKIAKEAAAKLG